MRHGLFLIAAVLGVSVASAGAQPSNTVPLDVLLGRAARYVAEFINNFSNIVCEETYVQESSALQPTIMVSPIGRGRGVSMEVGAARRRQLKSDFLIVNAEGDNVWHPFRDVFEVDGRAVRDREERVSKLFLKPTLDAQARAKQIADESSRFNLGNLQRTINNPVFPFLFLYADNQPRFRFAYTASGGPVADGVRVIAFTEESRPTLIQGLPGQAVPAHGRFWIEAATGRIVKSEILVTRVDYTASLTILFAVDERLQVTVPIEMRETYNLRGGNIKGTAKYGRFRRFAVSATEELTAPAVDDTEESTPPD